MRKKFAKVLILSHANDPDGLLSVILAQLAFAEVDYFLTNDPQTDITDYLQKNDIDKYEYVFMTDIYPGKPVLEALPNIYWFDHKQNSIDKIAKHKLDLSNAWVTVSYNKRPTSGSELFYMWLKKNGLLDSEADSFVELVRQNDTWDYKE